MSLTLFECNTESTERFLRGSKEGKGDITGGGGGGGGGLGGGGGGEKRGGRLIP